MLANKMLTPVERAAKVSPFFGRGWKTRHADIARRIEQGIARIQARKKVRMRKLARHG